jgi:hypothetical protein
MVGSGVRRPVPYHPSVLSPALATVSLMATDQQLVQAIGDAELALLQLVTQLAEAGSPGGAREAAEAYAWLNAPNNGH